MRMAPAADTLRNGIEVEVSNNIRSRVYMVGSGVSPPEYLIGRAEVVGS